MTPAHVANPVKEGAHGGTLGSPVLDGDRITIGEREPTLRRELP